MLMGAHAALLVRPHLQLLLLILLLLLSSSLVTTFGSPESDSLLKFKSSLANTDSLANWNLSTNPCPIDFENWNGVLCFDDHVWGLQLENMNLTGEIDVDSLLPLLYLRTLSFMNNNFEGPMPNFRKLGALKSLFLSNNQFSGPIPDDAFMDMASLKKVYLTNNKFSGNIPTSLASSPRLLELMIENNQFVGQIPDFASDFKVLNVSNNQLEGPIPTSLTNMDPTSFSGNKYLCGKPLKSPCNYPDLLSIQNPSPSNPPIPPLTNPNPPNHKPSPLRISIIIIAGSIIFAAILLFLIISINRSPQTPKYNQNNFEVTATAAVTSSPPTKHTSRKSERGIKLTFISNDSQRFDLQDLLRASAEVLGSGNFGSSYKALLMDGQAVVVKRFKQMSNTGREEFHEHMRRIGKLKHPNLLRLVAYYYRREEKLLVFDYVQNGSLASHLHGKHSIDRPALDWTTRLKIIKGVAKGLAYLHNELPSLILPHGHLKSSNVLLDKSFNPLLMDYTLVPVVNIEQAQQIMVAYKSPEYSRNGRTTKKTDVWSLGILILETLTGKFPANYLVPCTGCVENLSSWVGSIVREESTEVFDKELGNTKNSEEEMLKLLKIGVACCEEDLVKRWDLKDVVEKIEGLKEKDSDKEYHSEESFVL